MVEKIREDPGSSHFFRYFSLFLLLSTHRFWLLERERYVLLHDPTRIDSHARVVGHSLQTDVGDGQVEPALQSALLLDEELLLLRLLLLMLLIWISGRSWFDRGGGAADGGGVVVHDATLEERLCALSDQTNAVYCAC